MKNKLLGKDIIKNCSVCRNSIELLSGEQFICRKKGPVYSTDYCRKFKYDPLKRKPADITPLPKYKKEDFEI